MTMGRRAVPPDDVPPASAPAPRRMADETPPDPVTRSGPRHGVPAPDGDDDARHAWLILGALGAIMAMLVTGLYLFVGVRDTTTASPSPSSSTPAPEASTAVASPTATGIPSASGSPSPTTLPSPTEPEEPELLDLGDVVLALPDGWELYADELVQDDRRLVRVREPASDTRVQAVTLTTVGEDLEQACRDLVTDQQRAFTGVAESVVVDVPMTGAASGVSCAFTGTRAEDGVAAKVEFTLIRRDADAQSLIFRDTVPDAVAASDPVLAQLAAMECAAAETFGALIVDCQD